MKFTFSSWAIRNPIPPIILFLILGIAGMVAYVQLPINNMPSVVIPVVSISISQAGAAPAELEAQVTRKVESALTGILGVKHISSSISEGQSDTTIEFQIETDFDRAVSDVRDAISKIRDDLPRTILEPTVQRIEMDGAAIMTYSVEAPEMRAEDLNWYIDDTLSRELLSLRGVAKIERQGGVDHEITLTLQPDKLESYGITAAEISQQLAATNVDLPGGRITISGTERTLRTLGSAPNVAQLARTRIRTSNGTLVRLNELGTLTDGGAEPRDITRLNGKPVVTFSVYRAKGSSEVTVAKKVKEKLASLSAANPLVSFKLLFNIVDFTQKSFNSTITTFFEGALLTIIVVFWFLRDTRATVLSAIAIPLSIIPTFLCMHWLGFTLNGVSLLAISLVTGVLVDDAIVEVENIHRHMRKSKNVYQAAMDATNEIGLAVVATTMVICAVFMPVSFMGGISGQFFKQFGLTVAIAAFFSLVVARLLTPMIAAHWFKQEHSHDHDRTSRIKTRYIALVEWTLIHRGKTLLIAGLITLGSFALIPMLPTGFIPYDDLSQSQMTMELPRGATVDQTDIAAQHVASLLHKRPEVIDVMTSVTDDAGAINQASVYIKLVPPSQRTLDQRAFESDILKTLQQIPDMRINFKKNDGQKDVSITLVSENGDALSNTARALEREMRGMNELSGVVSTEGMLQPEIIITPDVDKAAELGITLEQISNAMRIATIGDNDISLAKYNYGNHQIPIRVRLPKTDYPDTRMIENLKIPNASGKPVPLKAFTTITYGTGPAIIQRYDRQRKIAIEANLNGIALGAALDKINQLPAMKALPASVTTLNTGDAEAMNELFAEFGKAIGAGLMLVYAIQVLLYKDWLQPFTRMAALPLSIGGAFVALLLTHTELGLPAIIGILMLMGIADKNSILLVDYIIELMARGRSKHDAILEACMTRARPILMTTLAMLAGMMPIALGTSEDGAFRAPMAIAVIGGLLSSTALSLIFVPMLFSYVKDLQLWLSPRLKKLMQ
jgi:hydrophobe/amphiphile efflux-1 (HAE1) family protein